MMAKPTFLPSAFVFSPYTRVPETALQSQFPEELRPLDCGPCRVEQQFSLKMNGKLYTYTLRNKVLPEDWLINASRAEAFSIERAEEYRGTPPSRAVRDALIKSNVEI